MKISKRLIVTGGAGFIGSNLVNKLVELGNNVIVIDNFATGNIEKLKKVKDKIEIINEDIANIKDLQKKLRKYKNNVDVIFHLAAIPRVERSVDKISETHQSNVQGIFGVLELAKFLEINKLIYTSSSSVYGSQKKNPLSESFIPNPQNPYAAQKLIGEIYADIYSKVFGIPIVTLRLFNVYGPGMEEEGAYKLVFAKWIGQIKKGEPLSIYGDGKQTRDFTYVSDTVGALIKASNLKHKNLHEIINIGSGRQISVNYLASLFDAPKVFVESRKFEERFKQADIRKARRLLSYSPKVTIEEGVKEFKKQEKIR